MIQVYTPVQAREIAANSVSRTFGEMSVALHSLTTIFPYLHFTLI